MSQPKAVVYCDVCNYVFSKTAVQIERAPITLDGTQYELVYFTCPKCGKLYRIALRDDHVVALSNDLEKMRNRISKQGSMGAMNLMVSGTMLQRKALRLRRYVEELNGKYPGTFAVVVLKDGSKQIRYLP